MRELDADIEKLRRELLELKEEGTTQEERFNDELYEAESELYKMRMCLLKKGEQSKSIWNFWDYAREVQQTLHSQPNRGNKPSPSVTTPPSESRALVAPWYFFNIHGLFEAMLLRRLHIAMMLQGQRDVQSVSWNGVIVHVYQMIPGIRESKKKSQADYEKTKDEIMKNIAHAKESYHKQLILQKELVHFMIMEAKKDDKEDLRQSMQSFESTSTQPLPDVVTQSPGGTSPTDDSSDASSLTSSDSSSSEEGEEEDGI